MSISEPPESPTAGQAPAIVYTVHDAIVNIQGLQQAVEPDTEVPLTSQDFSMYYSSDTDTVFADKYAYKSVLTKFEEESTRQGQLTQLLDEGAEFASMLYTWRQCSHGIPPIKSNEQHNRMEIYRMTVEVLKPEVDKLRRFMEFQKRALGQFGEAMKKLCQTKADFVSEEYLHTLGKVIGMFTVLDELKNIKASIKNDYSTFKRAAGILKLTTDPKEMEQMEHLSMFLATHGSILKQVKDRIKDADGLEDVICDIINTGIRMYENHTYILPQEKYGIVKVLGFCLYLMDGDKFNINKWDGKKKLHLSKIDKIFKQVEVVPLYGDMMIGPFKYILLTPNYDQEKWSHCLSEDRVSPQSELLRQMPVLHQEHAALVGELTWIVHGRESIAAINNKYTKGAKQQAAGQVPSHTDADVAQMYELALQALHRLAAWTGRVTELFSWKLLHPTCYEDNRSCPRDAEEYERATKYNYSSDEKFAMVELIAMIKGVQKLLCGVQQNITQAINRHIYHELQQLVQVTLREPLRKASKNKKEHIRNTLVSVRAIATDLMEGMDHQKDPLMNKNYKREAETAYQVKTPHKQTPPSSTQLYLVRTMLESLVEKGDRNVGRKSPRKDIDSQSVQNIELFLKQSYFWKYMVKFSQSLQSCCDLSQLWFREVYLEMTRGQKIQFPIEMSMPWILTSHILNSQDHSMIEYLLYPLDLYNDSAQCALTVFHKQFLYDEIEAEVNLCFDQFVYKLSEQIFEHYKWTAGCMALDRHFKVLCRKHGFKVKMPPRVRYQTLLTKQRVQLLGRSVDLKRLIGQRVTDSFLKSIDIAIRRFEAGDITGVLELDGLLNVNRLAHRLLSEFLDLPKFDTLLQEANHSVQAPCGRIALYIFYEVNNNFLQQFCYNAATDRFVKTVFPFADPIEREKMPAAAHYYLWGNKQLSQCYSTIYSHYSEFVGQPHFRTMVQVMGYQDVALVLKEMVNVIENMVLTTIMPYVETLFRVMPKRCKLPRFDYTSPGILEYFHAQLSDIMNYADLQPKVFHSMRVLGNAFLFCLHLEQGLTSREVTELVQAALFQNIIPKPFVPKKVVTETVVATDSGSKRNKSTRPPPEPVALNDSPQAGRKRNKSKSQPPEQVSLANLVQQGFPPSDRVKCHPRVMTCDCFGHTCHSTGDKTKEERDEEVLRLVKRAEIKHRNQNIVAVIDKLGTEDQKMLLHDHALLTREKLCCGLNIFPHLLLRLQQLLVDNLWQGVIPQNGILDVVENTEFHRLWSALQFVYCKPTLGNEYTVEQTLGEGLNWAGCILITLLGQQRRFEAMDYSYHLLKIHKTDQMDKKCRGVDLRKMADRIRKFQILNDQIFSILNKYLRPADANQAWEMNVEVEIIDPPPPELAEETIPIEMDPEPRDTEA